MSVLREQRYAFAMSCPFVLELKQCSLSMPSQPYPQQRRMVPHHSPDVCRVHPLSSVDKVFPGSQHVTVMQVLAKSGRLSVHAQNGCVRRTSSRSGNKATRPTRSRETLPLAGFSFVLGLFDALTSIL